jgi:hypothetical protein
MTASQSRSRALARIEYLKVQNFRALREVELKALTPLTVLLGPNGSGKSKLFDVFAFLAECFELGLGQARPREGAPDFWSSCVRSTYAEPQVSPSCANTCRICPASLPGSWKLQLPGARAVTVGSAGEGLRRRMGPSPSRPHAVLAKLELRNPEPTAAVNRP